jgi:hypothetical protein
VSDYFFFDLLLLHLDPGSFVQHVVVVAVFALEDKRNDATLSFQAEQCSFPRRQKILHSIFHSNPAVMCPTAVAGALNAVEIPEDA